MKPARAMERHRRSLTREPLAASRVSFTSCEHGSVWIRLHGADGQVFAFASLDADVGQAAVEALNEAVGEALAGGAAPCGQVH